MKARLGAVLRRFAQRFAQRDHSSGVWVAKLTLAAVISYLLAEVLGTSPDPLLAPLTALLVVQLTTYGTLTAGLDRIVSVVAGVLVAVVVATQIGLNWWSLGLVVAVSLVLGRLLRLGPNLLEVPISAMLVFAVGGLEDAAAGRVFETLLGAAVGVLVSLLVVPPLYLRPAGAAIGEVAHRMAEFSRCAGRCAASRVVAGRVQPLAGPGAGTRPRGRARRRAARPRRGQRPAQPARSAHPGGPPTAARRADRARAVLRGAAQPEPRDSGPDLLRARGPAGLGLRPADQGGTGRRAGRRRCGARCAGTARRPAASRRRRHSRSSTSGSPS